MTKNQAHAIVKFCAEECTRQHSGEMSVHRMFEAWLWMLTDGPSRIGVDTILQLGRIIDPYCNGDGFRTVRVSVGGSLRKVVDFHRVLGLLCESQAKMGVNDFYKEFELIHPFVDGNGRTGAIMYNAMSGTMLQPIETPDVKDKDFFSR